MYTWKDWRDIANIREEENIRGCVSYAIQSQYSASQKILALAAGYQEQIDPHLDVDMFYDRMFNIYSAQGLGLDNWGLILNMARNISDPMSGTSLTLEDEPYRLLLLYKAMANISASNAATQNKLLSLLISTGIGSFKAAAYVLEVDVMVIRWVFEYRLTPLQVAVFRTAGTLARGAGVGWELYSINPLSVFGFDGSGFKPFNQAPFAPDDALITYKV